MKVLLVNGSSHINGTTMRALEEMVKIFDAKGVETEVIQTGSKPLADCLQCNACAKTGRCVIDDDGVNAFVEKARTADGFVFATPVYYAHPSGRIFSFLDRAFYSAGKDVFRCKPGAAVAVAGSTYWNLAHGRVAEDAPEDGEGMQTLRNLARHMVWMMRCFAAGKEAGVPLPDTERGTMTNFVR